MTGAGAGFKEHYSAVRNFAISAAVLIYFVGIVYVYYYFRSFGVSLTSVQISPQEYYLFAYVVLTHDLGKTLGFTGILCGLVICYAAGVDALASLEQAPATQTTLKPIPATRKEVLRRQLDLIGFRALLTALGLLIVIVPFPAAFWWAHVVAAQDVASRYLASHEETSRAIRLVENVALGKTTPEFTATIKHINDAGDEGRAVQIAETGDRIFILVGATVGPADDAERQLPNDRVFAVNKSLVTVEDIWEKQDVRK